MPAADLSSLKIHDSARTKGAAGRVLAYISAVIGALVLLGGGVLALRGRKPQVEVTTVRAAGGSDQVTALNASGYVTPRRRATVTSRLTERFPQRSIVSRSPSTCRRSGTGSIPQLGVFSSIK